MDNISLDPNPIEHGNLVDVKAAPQADPSHPEHASWLAQINKALEVGLLIVTGKTLSVGGQKVNDV
jgi:hypothetical protein